MRDTLLTVIALLVAVGCGGERITSPTATLSLLSQGQTGMTLVEPAGPGSVTEFTVVGAATNWEAVLDPSRSNFNKHTVTTAPFEGQIPATDLFDMNVEGVTGYIEQITLRYDAQLQRIGGGDVGKFRYALSPDGGSTMHFGPELINNFNGIVSWDLTTNPETGRAWLKKELEDYEFGYFGSGWAPTEQTQVTVYHFEIEVTTRSGGVVTRTILRPKVDRPSHPGTPWTTQAVGSPDPPGYWRYLVDGSFQTLLKAQGGIASNAFILEKLPISKNAGIVRAVFVARGSDGTSKITPFIIFNGTQYDGTEFVVSNPGNPEDSATYVHEWRSDPTGEEWSGGAVTSMQGGIKTDPVTGISQLYELSFEVDHIQHPGPSVVLIRDVPPPFI